MSGWESVAAPGPGARACGTVQREPHERALSHHARAEGWSSLALILHAAALGPEGAGKVLVVFAPGTMPADAFASIVTAGGEPIRPALGDWAWIAHSDDEGFVGRLESHGALAAFRGAPAGLSLAGCFAWITEPEVPHDPFARALAARAAAR